MKVDRDMMALLKATKKVAMAPRQMLERVRKASELRLLPVEAVAASETSRGSDIAN
jgi:hypothetical protein